MALAYKAPDWLESAVRQKYGQRVTVLGATQSEIDNFMNKIRLQAVQFKERPQEVARQVVDIDKKEHINEGDEEDEVEIASDKGKEETKFKNYQLNLGESWVYSGSASLNVGATFFNVASAGVNLGASIQRKKSKEKTYSSGRTETLSQKYGVIETLTVSPRSKVTAEIITWAVTYQAPTTVQVSLPASLSILVRYRSPLAQMLGGFCTCAGFLTPTDLFRGRTDYHVEGGWVYFTIESHITYLGECAEFTKTEEPLYT